MTEPNLHHLIKDWYQRDSLVGDELESMPSPECPPLTRLWQLHAEGRPLDNFEDHVNRCQRCQRRTEIILRQRFLTNAPDKEKRRWLRPVPVFGGFLAAAACIAFVFVLSWPERDIDPRIVLFAQNVYGPFGDSPMRGDNGARSSEESLAKPEWLVEVLADTVVIEAIELQDSLTAQIVFAIDQNRLSIDRYGHLTVAPNIDEATARADGLFDLIERDQNAAGRLVDALLRALPDALESDRTALRQALNRWRAEIVFGIR